MSGRGPIICIGFGMPSSALLRIRIPYPPQNRTTFMVFSLSCFGIRDRGGMQGGEWKDELATPGCNVCKLLGQLGLEVPRQRQHDVGPVLGDLGGIEDRNAG